MSKQKIGLIGVGLMGHGIAKNILKGGWQLTYLDHPGNQDCDDLLEMDAKSTESAEDVAKASDIIILCVSGAPQVEEVITGGLLASLKPEAIVIDCSTSLPETSKKMADLIAQKGGTFLDAPMTRTSKEAESGRLNLLIGGSAETLSACRSLLECFAENIHHAGNVGEGHATKLIHNYVSLGFAAIVCEAATCAKSMGIEPDKLVDVLSNGGGGGVVLDRLVPMITNGDSSGLEFTISNAAKDLDYYCEMNSSISNETQCSKAVKELYNKHKALGHGERYVPFLMDVKI